MNNDPNNVVIDKSVRSVFVGNIPYEATEEKLKDIFTEVGPVVSFKLVFDRETGKPKGYGFCEFKDQETALSAMRNLNGFEIAGRTLRVDNACTEKSRMEIQSLMQVQETPAEPLHGPPVDPERAPETISKAVASLPPEQMFQLMQQMKMCIQNNPQEARTMLAQNPQLAYALLQAQVVMRIVDPETAVNMLHKPVPQIAPIGTNSRPPAGPMPIIGMPMQGSRPDMAPDAMRLEGRLPDGPAFNAEVRPPFSGEDRRDPRNRDPRGDRSNGIANMRNPPPPITSGAGLPQRGPPPQLPPHLAGADPEKAQLIMQVLQLTEEQIAMLPPQQRESIMVLKEQINKGPR